MLIKRQDAIAAGLKRYFNGVPCKSGHLCERWTNDCSCVECKKIKSRAFCADWRIKNTEKTKLLNKEWRKNNTDSIKEKQAKYYASNKEAIKEKARIYYHENKTAVLERVWKYRSLNVEKIRSMHRMYYAENIESRRHANRAIRAKRLLCEGKHTKQDIERICKAQKRKCAVCKKSLIKYHVDHVIPLAKGGTNYPENLQLLCPNCNHRKSDKDPLIFMQQNGFLL